MHKITIFILILIISQNVQAGWKTSVSSDEMEGTTQHYAMSSSVAPTKELPFPYKDLKSWVGVGCEVGQKEPWVFFGHNKLHVTGGTISKGSTIYRFRIKFDDDLGEIQLSRSNGSNFLHVNRFSDQTIQKLASANQVLLEVMWYQHGKVLFKYDMSGSATAITKISSECKL